MPEVEVRRSKRRRRTVSAYRDGDRVVVLLPARMTRAEEREWVDIMVDRVIAQERRRRPSDKDLQERADRLSRRYLDGTAVPESVRWVDNQAARWGSCTPSDRTIRLSSRLRGMPAYVIDYVLLHELAHLLEPGHTPRFWELVGRFPQMERARGFLDGVSAAAELDIGPCEGGGQVDGGADEGADSEVDRGPEEVDPPPVNTGRARPLPGPEPIPGLETVDADPVD